MSRLLTALVGFAAGLVVMYWLLVVAELGTEHRCLTVTGNVQQRLDMLLAAIADGWLVEGATPNLDIICLSKPLAVVR